MDPHIAVHGSFSVMVNYHAIGLYFTSRSGFALHNPQEEASLKVSAFVLTGNENEEVDACWDSDDIERLCAASNQGGTSAVCFVMGQICNLTTQSIYQILQARSLLFPHLCHVFQENIVRFGPNDFFVLQKSMKEDTQQPTLKAIVALLKLGDWDPDVFYKFRDIILNQVPVCGLKLRNDLCQNLPRVWANHYLLDKDKDISFEVGRFYYGIREHEKALEYYRTSTVHTGVHHVTYHNMGLCYYSLGNLKLAAEYFSKSLSLNPDYEKARSWRLKVCREVEESATGVAQTDEDTPIVG